MKRNTKGFFKKVVSSVSAAAIASTMMVGGAFAAAPVALAESASPEGYVTCSAFAAAESAPEILGLTNMGTRGTGGTVGKNDDWSNLNYIIWGTNVNSNPNPYMVNAVTNYENGNSEAAPSTMLYTRVSPSPASAMRAYGAEAASDWVWEQLPDIILGVNAGGAITNPVVDYSGADYAQAVATATETPDYNPVGILYNMTNCFTQLDTMYEMAAVADQIVAESEGAKQLRYGNATDITKQFEEYIRGSQGYVLAQLDADKKEKKTVALVNNYDSASGTFNLTQTGVAEGTVTGNRYLEAVQNVAVNVADSMTAGEDGKYTVTAEDLANVDLILVGTLSGGMSTNAIIAGFDDSLLQKTYWVDSDRGNAGATFSVSANAVENAQNFGRILGCLYPEYIDQSDMIAYYYDNFYHIADGQLGPVIDKAMDGVRNWNADATERLSWNESDVADYNAAETQDKFIEGLSYIEANLDELPEYMAVTDNYGEVPEYVDPTPEVKFPDVKDGEWYTDAIYAMARRGLILGNSDGTYGFGKNLTRAQFAVILWRYDQPDESAAYDINSAKDNTGMSDLSDGKYYTGAANWAVENGYINGKNTKQGKLFAPGDPVTAEQMCAILGNYIDAEGAKAAPVSVLSKYSDGAKVSSWAKSSVAWAVNKGIIGNGTEIKAQSSIKRERVAAILDNAFNTGLLTE